MADRTYSPEEVFHLSGATQDAVRNLRHRGYLANYGAQDGNGRWRYSARDVVAFWLARALHNSGDLIGLAELYRSSWVVAGLMLDHLSGVKVPQYAVRDFHCGGGTGIKLSDQITDADFTEWGFASAWCIHSLAKRALADLGEAVRQ